MDVDITRLPDDVDALKDIIFNLKSAHVESEQKYRARIDFLEERIRLFQKELFGRKSEKLPPDDVRQLQLFNETEALENDQVAESDDQLEVPAHIRKRPKRKPLPKELPRVEVIHDLKDEEKICECGQSLSRIGEEVSEKLDIVPATARVIRHVRYKYACKACEGVESEGPTVKIAPVPAQIIPKGIATPGLLAHIAVSKYADALPLYRQEKIYQRIGIELSRVSMASWMVRVADCAKPLVDLLKEKILASPVINIDETPVQVLNGPGKANTSKSYMWAFRGGTDQKPLLLFEYHPNRSGQVARDFLDGYKGYVQTDAFSGYDALDQKPDIRRLGCFAHVRRKFMDVIKARPKAERNKNGSAEVAIDYIRKLYAVEKKARQGQLCPAEIYHLRQNESKPVLDAFKEWMDKRVDLTPPKGLLGKAFHYALSNWDKLVRYLEDGRLKPDNNAAENAIRPFVVGRKNWLFAGHPNGAEASATLYSLIETAKACGLEPYRYLRFIFESLPLAQNREDYQSLLPQNLNNASL